MANTRFPFRGWDCCLLRKPTNAQMRTFLSDAFSNLFFLPWVIGCKIWKASPLASKNNFRRSIYPLPETGKMIRISEDWSAGDSVFTIADLLQGRARVKGRSSSMVLKPGWSYGQVSWLCSEYAAKWFENQGDNGKVCLLFQWKTGKIDVDSGAADEPVQQIPVHASSASRAKHNCTTIRFGEGGSRSVCSAENWVHER